MPHLKHIFRAFLLFCLLSLPASAQADNDPFHLSETPFYKQLDGFTGYNMPVMQIAQKIKKKVAAEPDKLSIAMKWAEDNMFPRETAKVNALYFMLYADLNIASLPAAHNDRESYKKYTWAAFQSMVLFEALLTADAARCSGVDAKPAAAKLLGPRYAALDVYGLFWRKKIEHAWETALDFEQAAAKRPGNAEVCGNGIFENENEAPPAVTPAYIDDAAWNKSREKIRADLKTYWEQRYTDAVKPPAK